MQPALLALVLLVLTSIGYYLGRGRSLRVANGSARVLHSLPSYYGFYTALWCGIPALLLLAAWLLLEPAIVTRLVVADLPSEMRELPEARRDLVVNDIENVLKDNTARDADPGVLAAAERYRHLQGLSAAALAVAVLSLALGGGTYALRSIRVDLRARNRVEAVIRVLLITGSTIAIFTTIGMPAIPAGLNGRPTTDLAVLGFSLPTGASLVSLTPAERRLLLGEFCYNQGGSVMLVAAGLAATAVTFTALRLRSKLFLGPHGQVSVHHCAGH
jgi:hypothetical protein